MSDYAFLAYLSNTLQADIDGLAQTAPDNTEAAQTQAQEAVTAYLTALKQTYHAQLAFAQHSLSAIGAEHPQQYTTTLEIYRTELQAAYLRELALVRAHAILWIAPARQPQLPPHVAPFEEALRERAQIVSPNMIALQELLNHSKELVRSQLDIKRQYILRHLEGSFDTLPNDREFLSCTALPDFASEAYINTRAQLFRQAEELWSTYATCAARLVCPVKEMQPAHEHNSYVEELLLRSHENWLARLLRPMR